MNRIQHEFERTVWPYRLALPFLFAIGAIVQVKKTLYRIFGGRECKPKTNFWFVDGLSINSRRVKDGAMQWRALDVVYNFTEGEGGNWITRAIDDYWMHIRNAQAARNRLKLVKRELHVAILKVAETKAIGEPVRILSLAAGSGQGVIEVIEELQRHGVMCEVLFIDQDDSALAHAQYLAGIHDVNILTRKADVLYFESEVRGFKPDIVEMCGFMDYLSDRLAIIIIKKIHRRLQPNGLFLTCHIHPNWEKYFIWQQENWSMLYRTRRQLRELLVEGGFLSAQLYTEPLRIHSVAVARKL